MNWMENIAPQMGMNMKACMEYWACMEYCCHVWAGAASCYLELLDKL